MESGQHKYTHHARNGPSRPPHGQQLVLVFVRNGGARDPANAPPSENSTAGVTPAPGLRRPTVSAAPPEGAATGRRACHAMPCRACLYVSEFPKLDTSHRRLKEEKNSGPVFVSPAGVTFKPVTVVLVRTPERARETTLYSVCVPGFLQWRRGAQQGAAVARRGLRRRRGGAHARGCQGLQL
jgi:hypothetical protein